MSAPTVLLVDDHPVFRRGLSALLVEEGATVVGEVGTAAEATQEAVRLRPQIVVMDLHLPDGSGVDAIRRLLEHDPATRVLVLSMDGSAPAVVAALRAGARGFLLKEAAAESIGSALHTLLRDELVLDARFAALLPGLLRQEGRERPAALAGLTPRELEIAELVAAGHSNGEVGRRLFLAEKTVRNAMTTILAKTGLESRGQLQVLLRDGSG